MFSLVSVGVVCLTLFSRPSFSQQFPCLNATSGTECVSNDCTWLEIPYFPYECGACYYPQLFGGVDNCTAVSDFNFSGLTGVSTYCDQTYTYDGVCNFDGGSSSSFECHNASSAVECVLNDCTWVELTQFFCGVCAYPFQLGETECVEDDMVSFAGYNDLNTFCNVSNLGYTDGCDTSSGDSGDNSTYDNGGGICHSEDLYGASACLTSGYNCSWIEISTYMCGVCASPSHINGSYTQCIEESIIYDGHSSEVICDYNNANLETDCHSFDSGDSDDDDDICEYYATSAVDCFSIDDICIWMEPNDDAWPGIGLDSGECGVCVNMTKYSNKTDCESGALAAQEVVQAGGFYMRCSADEIVYNSSCFGPFYNGTGTPGDDESCFDVDNADDCIMYIEYGCAWVELGTQGCGGCVDVEVLNTTNCTEGQYLPDEDAYVRCSNTTVTITSPLCDFGDSGSGTDSFDQSTQTPQDPDTTQNMPDMTDGSDSVDTASTTSSESSESGEPDTTQSMPVVTESSDSSDSGSVETTDDELDDIDTTDIDSNDQQTTNDPNRSDAVMYGVKLMFSMLASIMGLCWL